MSFGYWGLHTAAEYLPMERRLVPLTDLITPDMAGVLHDYDHRGYRSETPGEPVYLKVRSDIPGKYELADGHHRVADAIRNGRDHVWADIDPYEDDEPYEPPFYDFSQHMGDKAVVTPPTVPVADRPKNWQGYPAGTWTDQDEEEWNANHTASTDGIRYAHIVEADVAEDLRRLASTDDDDGSWIPRTPNGTIDIPKYLELRKTRPQKPEPKTQNLYHITTNPDFDFDADITPTEGKSLSGNRLNNGVYLTDMPTYWRPWGKRPYVVSVSVPTDLVKRYKYPITGDPEYPIPAEKFSDLKINKVMPWHGYEQETRHEWAGGDPNPWNDDVRNWSQDQRRQYEDQYSRWHDNEYGTDEEEDNRTAARLAMPQPLPQGIYFRYHPELMWSPGVTAHLPGGKQVGSLEWYDDDHVMVDLGTRRPGEIDRIGVHPDWQGQSVATSMFDFAQQYEPRLHHSEELTEDGRGWSAYEKSRHAAVTQDLVDRLKGEFHAWRRQQPRGSIFGGGIIGGLNEWTNIEKFLKDRYPAAHRNLSMGHEQAGMLMDGYHPSGIEGGDPDRYDYNPDASFAPYETGPEAEAKHGYDPKEIAAGMLLLHNKTDRFRGDLSQEDQARLNDIAQKRYQMQRAYEQRNARLAMPAPMPDGIEFKYHPDYPYDDYGHRRGPTAYAVKNYDQIGYVTWHPGGEVKMIEVHPDYRRHGIGTALFDFAKQHEPNLHHSPFKSDLGDVWSDYEKSRHARLAMAWDQWAPLIRGGCSDCQPGGEGRYTLPQAGAFLNYAHGSQQGRPVVKVIGIYTHPSDRGGGVAEALIRRLHDDHPGLPIVPGYMTADGQGFHDRLLDKDPENQKLLARRRWLAGANGPLPPMTMEPFGTKWSNGIMARHAEDGRPLGHLHWYDDGEIETVRVHPDFQRRGIASAMLRHANADPDTYEREPGAMIHHSNNLSAAGRAWANADGHHPADEEVEEADGDPHTWGWTAVKDYVPAHIPYTGQNEAEMSECLFPEHPELKVPYKLGGKQHRWPTKWGGDHPDVPFDKRWGPNHPHHIPAPWEG